ncbi:MAG TPA: hypothetical protein VK395_35840 [Gemmataceae bacterium]|nr:hypothetical protein [Gemmataceae bacterium]
MRKAHVLTILVAAATSASVGCGSCAEAFCGPMFWYDGPRFYGGVRMDAEEISENAKKLRTTSGEEISSRVEAVPVIAFFSAHMPLSAIADTLAIPIVMYEREQWRSQHNQQATSPAPGGEPD